MKGATVNAHTFMTRSGNHSTKGSRRGFVDVETGVDPASLLTPAQQRDSLKRKHAALAVQRSALQASRASKPEWQRIGREMFDVQTQIRALNDQIIPDRSAFNFDAFFRLCAITALTPIEYERVAEAARRRMIEEKTA